MVIKSVDILYWVLVLEFLIDILARFEMNIDRNSLNFADGIAAVQELSIQCEKW